MENMIVYQSLFEDFLIQLEALALSAEDKQSMLERINDDYKYIKSMLDVLSVSKLTFVNSYFSFSKHDLEVFTEKVSKIITYPEKLNEILQEMKNLYYLKENNLLEEETVREQKDTAINKIDEFTLVLNEFINTVDYKKNKDQIKKIKKYIENIIALADIVEKDGEITDINFFKKVVEDIELTEHEKQLLISKALMNNVSIYRNKGLIYKDEDSLLEEYIEEDEILDDEPSFQIEELLDEMLREDEDNYIENQNVKVK